MKKPSAPKKHLQGWDFLEYRNPGIRAAWRQQVGLPEEDFTGGVTGRERPTKDHHAITFRAVVWSTSSTNGHRRHFTYDPSTSDWTEDSLKEKPQTPMQRVANPVWLRAQIGKLVQICNDSIMEDQALAAIAGEAPSQVQQDKCLCRVTTNHHWRQLLESILRGEGCP